MFSLCSFEKVLFWIAVPSTIMLVFQAVFTFIGMEGYSNDLPEINSDSSPAEFSMDGHFPILTIRNVIIFFSVFRAYLLLILNFYDHQMKSLWRFEIFDVSQNWTSENKAHGLHLEVLRMPNSEIFYLSKF